MVSRTANTHSVAVMIKTVVVTLITGIIVICLTLAARAQQLIHSNKHVLPPIEFDRPYTGYLTLRIAKDIEEVKLLCDLPVARALACSFGRGADRCAIVILPAAELLRLGWNPWHVLRHELGHCNGWRADHPGERIATPEDDRRWKRLFDESNTSPLRKADRSAITPAVPSSPAVGR